MLEMELKFRVDDFSLVESRLRELGLEPGPEVHENNVVLDATDGSLGRSNVLFRLRDTGDGTTLLTVKKPLPSTFFKVRMEREAVLEYPVEDAVELFRLLGYDVVYKYGKSRRECSLGTAKVCLDVIWFGNFVELEAESEDALLKAVRLLGFDPDEGIGLSYADLEREAERNTRSTLTDDLSEAIYRNRETIL